MSGFEVVGLVLAVVGVLPAAVETLRSYKSLLSSIKHVERDLRSLIQDLETEQVRLRTTCEILLDGVAPYSIIDQLIENPFSPDWAPYKDQLRLRLWTSSRRFEEQVSDMQKAAQELMTKLCIQADGKTRITEKRAIITELKRATSFTLKKKDYEEIITRIKDGNSILHELAGQNSGLEPGRKRRSQARLIKLIRGLSQGVFNALRNATTCQCAHSHNVCLELIHRNIVLVPSDLEEQVAKDVIFHVVLGSNDEKALVIEDEVTSGQPASWNGVQIRLENPETEPMSSPPSSRNDTVAIIKPERKMSRRVNWFSSSTNSSKDNTASATQTIVEVSRRLVAVPMYAPKLISNLCQAVLRRQKAPAEDCYGYISDVDRKFGLYPPQDNIEAGTAITLRQVLDGNVSNYPQFDYPEKLKVALAVAVNVLHLYETPWLARIITLDDVIFLHNDGDGARSPQSQYRPFITRSLPERQDTGQTGIQQNKNKNKNETLDTPRPFNLAVLSLGALLIQIIIGRSVDTLEMMGNADINSILSMHETGSQFNDKILENGGINYMITVKWCLESVRGIAGLEDDSFCQRFYTEVVARLEEDVKLLES